MSYAVFLAAYVMFVGVVEGVWDAPERSAPIKRQYHIVPEKSLSWSDTVAV
jgi:hypothetical protein